MYKTQRSRRECGKQEAVKRDLVLEDSSGASLQRWEGEIADFLPKAESALGSTKTYKVGDYYDDGAKQGVVFEVTPDGKHGKIVSLTESSEALQWTSDDNEQERARS